MVSKETGATLRCQACAHRCRIREGQAGICKVRFHESGTLLVPWGYVSGVAVDPIEKKPFYHVFPGQTALSFGMLGCDMHCGYCQNWFSSQALRDTDAGAGFQLIQPEELVRHALRAGSRAVVSTYNEPLISAEWAAAIFDLAQEEGLVTGFVSNGNATPEVLDFLAPRLDLFKVDLKTFEDREYRRLGARLRDVLASIEGAAARGLWVEVVTLVVPGLNDSSAELSRIATFLASVSRDIPWHVTAFHPLYRMTDRPATSPDALRRALRAGREAGLNYVYPGNLPGLEEHEATRCPGCNAVLVERSRRRIARIAILDGCCNACGERIPGVW